MTEQIQTLYGRLECICRDLQVLCKVFSLGSFSNFNGDGDGKEDVKKAIGLSRKTTTLHVHHAFLFISLLSLHDFLFLSLNLSAVLKKSTPVKLAYTCHFQQIGINATKMEKTGIHFKSDVFAAVAIDDAEAP